MKFFLAVFVVFNIVLAINAKEIDPNLEEKCLKELEIDQEAYKAALEKRAEDADTSIKCMSKCMLKEKKMINEDGAFDVQQIAASLFTEPENVEVAKPFIESCLKGEEKEAEKKEEEAKNEPSCEEAYEMILCVTKKIEEALRDN